MPMRFMCFGGAAAVAVGCNEVAAAAARRRGQRGRSLSFRGMFLSGKGGKKKPSPAAEAKKKGGVDADADLCGASTASSSVPSSAPLSSASSLDSAASSLSSSCSSSSFSGALPPPAPAKRRATTSLAAGAAAVVLCLLMVVCCGRVGATLLTSTVLYLFPRRWPVTACKQAGDDVEEPPESDAVSASEATEETAKRKVVMEGFLLRNRKK